MNTLLLFTLLLSQSVIAGDYSFLAADDYTPKSWSVEKFQGVESTFREDANYNLKDLHKAFRSDKQISVYLGLGYEAYASDAPARLLKMLVKAARQYGIRLYQLQLSNGRVISFSDAQGTRWQWVIGHERNEFAASLAQFEVVMYHGHSRYGRGPTFDSFTNYFRMGNVWDVIEVDTRNRYFRNDPILDTEKYPLSLVAVGEESLPYQYRGQLEESSYLLKEAFTKRIPGLDVDLKATAFSKSPQMLFLLSCRNRYYFKEPIRSLFPNVEEKFIFGTKEDSSFSYTPVIAFMISLIRQVPESKHVLAELESTQSCAKHPCFTTY